jgi:hypothetical protein
MEHKDLIKIRNILDIDCDKHTHGYDGLTIRNTYAKDILKYEDLQNFDNELRRLTAAIKAVPNVTHARLGQNNEVVEFSLFGNFSYLCKQYE